jgi:hypothetical protein
MLYTFSGIHTLFFIFFHFAISPVDVGENTKRSEKVHVDTLLRRDGERKTEREKKMFGNNKAEFYPI